MIHLTYLDSGTHYPFHTTVEKSLLLISLVETV